MKTFQRKLQTIKGLNIKKAEITKFVQIKSFQHEKCMAFNKKNEKEECEKLLEFLSSGIREQNGVIFYKDIFSSRF